MSLGEEITPLAAPAERIVAESRGNAGTAIAAYAVRAGLAVGDRVAAARSANQPG